jgi:hypothetical protein
MKIETTVQPRKDGKVTVTAEGGTKYVFQADEYGAMVCDVENEAHAAWLLGLGDFHPADAEDFAAAELLMQSPEGDGEADGGIPGLYDDEDDEDDEPVDLNAAPIEEPASAVAAPAPVRAARARKAK